MPPARGTTATAITPARSPAAGRAAPLVFLELHQSLGPLRAGGLVLEDTIRVAPTGAAQDVLSGTQLTFGKDPLQVTDAQVWGQIRHPMRHPMQSWLDALYHGDGTVVSLLP